MPPPPVLSERRGRILVVRMNRPHALNAVDAALSAALGAALEELAADGELWAAVITGVGDRAFCAGADLKELAAGRPAHAVEHPEWGFAGMARHFVSKPLIAAVNGLAYGGGLEIALACDLVVASDKARFALPEVKRGILAAGGGLVRLGRQVPLRLALEMALTGEAIDAETALRHGLVNRVVTHERVLDEALRLADQICANAPLAVQASKRALHAVADGEPSAEPELWRIAGLESASLRGSHDAREGLRAFAEKRPPVWQGR